jgi:enoyl-CoA hydratase/carnithine racemase
MRVVAHSARLGITPSKIGAAYSLSDTRRLVALVGPARAKDMLFSGRLLDSEEALSVGLVDRRCDSGQLAEVARACIEPWLNNSSHSIAHTKRSILSIAGIAPVADADLQAGFEGCFAGPDFAEGYAAFLAKRSPRFQ